MRTAAQRAIENVREFGAQIIDLRPLPPAPETGDVEPAIPPAEEAS